MAHPFAAAQRVIELCRMYESHAPLLLYYSGGLLPILQEIILFEVVRFLLLSNVRSPSRTFLLSCYRDCCLHCYLEGLERAGQCQAAFIQ